jgi:uncharacterized membrane protein YfcA
MTTTLIGALVIGLTLGMLGSGGSAITVPVLVYLVGHGAKESIAESMAIVGLISIAAAIPYAKARLIDWRSVWFFGIPGMFGTFIGAWVGGLATDAIQLVVFGAVLLIAAYSMVRKPKQGDQADADKDAEDRALSPAWKVAIEGTIVGIVTGFVGVGGGFLIVPALVLLGNLPMRLAIGTSLVIIAAKSAIGFAKYEQFLLSHDSTVNVQTILIFVLIGVFGSLGGRAINSRLNQRMLRNVFAGLLLVLGGFVIVREGSKVFNLPVDEVAGANMMTSLPSGEHADTKTRPDNNLNALRSPRGSVVKLTFNHPIPKE